MKTKKMFALPVMVATAALALGGCVTVDNTPVSAPKTETTEEAAQPQPAEEVDAPAPSDGGGEAEAPAPSDGGGEGTEALAPSDGGGESEGSPAPDAEEVELSPEEGTLYLRAIQGFSPELEAWTIDTDADAVEYRRYNCLGTTSSVGVGTIAPREGGDEGDYLISWEGDSPMPAGSGASQEERVTMTDRTLEVSMDVSSTHHDIELERFGGMCKSTGEAVARFVL